MKPNPDYTAVESVAPFKGLFTTQASNRLDPAFSPKMLNAMVRDGELMSRFGYTKIGQTLDGEIRALTQFGPLGGVTNLTVMTSKRQYYYDAATNLFIDISRVDASNNDGITAVVSGASGTFTLGVTDNTLHFTAGDIFAVTGSTGNDGDYTVASSTYGTNTVITVVGTIPDATVDGTVRFSHNHPIVTADGANTLTILNDHTSEFVDTAEVRISGSTANDGTYTVDGNSTFGASHTTVVLTESLTDSASDGDLWLVDTLTTSTDQHIDFAEVTDVNSRRIIMTNGNDSPLKWSGATSDSFRQWRPSFVNFATMRTISVFRGFLVLGGITLLAEDPQAVVWSDSGDFDDFEGGVAGTTILSELESPIKTMKTLGDRLIIYSDDQIVNAVFVGADVVFSFETVINEGTRLISPTAVVPISIGHVYASEENIYLYDGSKGLRIVGGAIRNDYKLTKDFQNLQKTAVLNDFSKRTIYIAVPDVDGGSMVYTFEYDIFNPAAIVWGKEKYADAPRAFGFLINTINVTWDDTPAELLTAPNPWSGEVGTWGGEGTQINFPVRVFGTEGGEVFSIAEDAGDDNGTAYTMNYETVDLTIPETFQSTFGRWAEIEFEAKGVTIDISVSVDLGGDFTLVELDRSLNGNYSTHVLPIDISGRTLRVRFQTTDAAFGLRWVRGWVREGGAR